MIWIRLTQKQTGWNTLFQKNLKIALTRSLGYPTVDPHGAPIPSKSGEISFGNYRPLSEVEVGEKVQIRQVSDQSSEMLRYMGSMGLKPNVKLEVKERAPFNGPMEILVDGSINILWV